MSAAPWPPMWPCHKCGRRGRRNLGTQGWCEIHLGELYAGFHLDVWMTADQHSDALIAAAHDRLLLVSQTETPDDDALVAWGERLRRAVEVGIVMKPEAERAWRRAVRHAAA